MRISVPLHRAFADCLAKPNTLVMDLTSNQERFAPVDAAVRNAILQGHTPGAVVLVGHEGKVVYRKAFGSRSLDPAIEPMTVDTIFDMASLTKVMATTSSVMRLVQLGQIKLNDPVAKYIPEFAQNGKEEVTIRQLLTHYSGLRADLDLKPEWTGQEEAFRLANAEKLVTRQVRPFSIATSTSLCWVNWCSGSAGWGSTRTPSRLSSAHWE